MQIKDVLKKKANMLIVMSLSIIGDVIPIIVIMIGIWIVKYFSKLFGFEDSMAIMVLEGFSQLFMIILYMILAIASIVYIYKLFKEGEL